ncbi:RNA-directed DNA polymerase [Thauera butanivorans]|uniref:RNA-directed DNA polymerase n=1 Tax=Thauera butanivorans TaxID=86174 RepID=UPI000A04E017|nr:RNA-directed DNA polymerase [Thauera butanivorans]
MDAQPGTAAWPTGAAAERGSHFLQLTALPHLFQCWLKARRNKGGSARIQRFGEDPLRYLKTIQDQLRSRAYAFGPYRSFTVKEKKFRDVVDAPMKDRIVHWMLYDYLLSIWMPRFIADTYGNLPGRGTHAAVRRLANFCRSPSARFVLQLDISKYFYAVPHSPLKARALRYIGDQDIRRLIVDLIDSWRTDGRYDELFPAGGAYRSTVDKGMPPGNLPSQLLANIFLSDFDHWVKQDLGVKRYIRFVDDLVIIADTADELRHIDREITQRLAEEGLTIHPHKIRLAPVAAGVPFLGYVAWPAHVSAGRYIRYRYLQRLRRHESGARDYSESLSSYRAMFAHTGATR